MEFIIAFCLFFIFVSLYFSFLFLILFFKNKNRLFKNKKLDRFPMLSVLIPAFNEENNIARTLSCVLNCDYPKELLEVIVINDGSTDNTSNIVKKFKKVKIINKKNTGKADSLNIGLRVAKGEVVAIIDADSYPERYAFKKMIGFFNDKMVSAVTSCILVKKPKNLLEKLQAIEYMFIAWTRKLFQYIDSIYVTPGALSMYRKDVVLSVGGFDKKNLTEDIELTWNLLKHNHKVKMCLDARTFTTVPDTLRKWWKQRVRWNIGGLQTINKYKSTFFNKKFDMLGLFITPFFIFSFILSLTGFFIFGYMLLKKVIYYLSFFISLYVHKTSFYISGLYFTPVVFTFFWIVLFLSTLVYVYCCFKKMNSIKIGFKNLWMVFLYLLVYLALLPLIHLHAIYNFIVGDLRW